MTAENKIGIFGNGPGIEFIRDITCSPLFIFKYEVCGQENLASIPTSPAILYFFPHTSHLDPFSVRFASQRDVRKYEMFPAAKDYWYQNRIREMVHSLFLNTYPMERQNISGMSDAMEISRRVLDAGLSLVIAPEGTRTLNPDEERILHNGPTDLALQGGYPIIPIRLRGFADIMPKGHLPKLSDGLHRHQVSVIFGEPISVPKVEKYSVRRIERRNLTRLLRDKLLTM